MICGWSRRDDYWTNTNSPGFARDRQYRGCLETRRHGSSGLNVAKKNGMWLLRDCASELLRQDSAADTGHVLRGCQDIPGSGGSARSMQEVQDSEAGEAALAGKQSLLHEAVLLLRGKKMSCHDRQRRGQRTETGLARCQDIGEGVHGGAASTQPCGSPPGNRDRRTISAEGAYVPDRGQRSGAWTPDLVWRERPGWGKHGYVFSVALGQKKQEK